MEYARDPYTQRRINQLEMVQRRAARFVMTNYSREASLCKMLNELPWKPLSVYRRQNRLTIMYKILNHLSAIKADDYVTISKPDCLKFSSFPTTINEWNELPSETVSVESYLGN